MGNIIVIGGGVSGCAFAISAARRGGGEKVTVIEASDRLLKKLALSGNGRGNLCNKNLSAEHFDGDGKFVESVIRRFSLEDERAFLSGIGVATAFEGDRLYPYGFQASGVSDAMIAELQRLKVNVIFNERITSVEKKGGGYLLNGKYACDTLALAFGGSAYKKLFTDGQSFCLAKALAHSVTETAPALCRLYARNKSLQMLRGIKRDVTLTVLEDGVEAGRFFGEMHFGDTFISGSVTFSASLYISRALLSGKKVRVSLDLAPEFSLEEIRSYAKDKTEKYGFIKRELLFSTLLHNTLSRAVFIENGVSLNGELRGLTAAEIERLCAGVKAYGIEVQKTFPFDDAQVSLGGVPTKEVDENFRSKKSENAYLLGELLDVTGECGGYNLWFAFASGCLAAASVPNT